MLYTAGALCFILQEEATSLSDILPLETLANVCNLTVQVDSFSGGRLEWPNAYDQLTGLTRLSLYFSHDLRRYLPDFLTGMNW